jgi:uncharacterized protein (TIGR02246 family)
MKRFLIALGFTLTVAGAAFARSASSGDAALDRAIAQANREWLTAMRSGDVASIVKPYAEDAVFVGPDGTATLGRAAIGDLMRNRFSRNGLALSTAIETHRVVVDGDIAVEIGVAEVLWQPAGVQATGGKGGYLTAWRRQKDGTWKIYRNVILP